MNALQKRLAGARTNHCVSQKACTSASRKFLFIYCRGEGAKCRSRHADSAAIGPAGGHLAGYLWCNASCASGPDSGAGGGLRSSWGFATRRACSTSLIPTPAAMRALSAVRSGPREVPPAQMGQAITTATRAGPAHWHSTVFRCRLPAFSEVCHVLGAA